MPICAVADCRNSTEEDQLSNASFFTFPTDESQLGKWLLFCSRSDGLNTKTARICNLHFKKDDFENLMKFEMGFASKLKLNKDAVPTVHVIRKAPSPLKNTYAVRKAFETLTKEVDSMKQKIADLHKENFILRTAEEDYKKQIKKLQLELTKSECMIDNTEEKLREVFSPGQIRRIKNSRRVLWSEQDMANAIQLYEASSRAYKLLIKWQYPLPAVRTLLAHQKKERMMGRMGDEVLGEEEVDRMMEDVSDQKMDDLVEEIKDD